MQNKRKTLIGELLYYSFMRMSPDGMVFILVDNTSFFQYGVCSVCDAIPAQNCSFRRLLFDFYSFIGALC